MSKFFKSMILLLTAGLFTATGWGAGEITEVIAINFGSDRQALDTSADGDLGFVTADGMLGAQVPLAKWNNVSGASGTDVNVAGAKTETSYLLTYSSPNTWNSKDNNTYNTSIGNLTKGYLDVSNAGGGVPEISLSGMPTTGYDVAVILSGDGGTFGAVTVNDIKYIGSNDATIKGSASWGTRQSYDSLAEGQNVVFVTEQSAETLTIVGDCTTSSARASIAGLMVFFREIPDAQDCTFTVTEEGGSWDVAPSTEKPCVATINFAETTGKSVNLTNILSGTNVTSLKSLSISGTNGGTITNTDGITAGSIEINTNVTIPSSFATPAVTTIAEGVSVYFTGETTWAGSSFPYSGNRHFETIKFTAQQMGEDIENYTIAANEQMLFTNTNVRYVQDLILDGGLIKTQGNGQAWFGGEPGNRTFTIKSGIADLTSVTTDNGSNAVLIGFSRTGNSYNIQGGLLDASNTSIMGYQGASTLQMSGGLVKTKGFRQQGTNFTGMTLTGGTIELGAGGIPNLGMASVTLGAATIRATANATIEEALNVTGAATLQAVDGKTLTVSGTISGDGTIAIGGTGTTKTRADDGTYSDVIVNATGTVYIGTNRPKIASIAEGATLQIALTDEEVANGISWTVGENLTTEEANRLTVVGAELDNIIVTNGTLTATLASNLAASWENGAWSQTPVDGAPITITFSEGYTTCTFTNTEEIELASLTIKGETAGEIVLGEYAVTVSEMTVEPAEVTIPVALFNSFDAQAYTVESGKTLKLKGDADVSKTMNVNGTLVIDGSMNFTAGNHVYNGGKLDVASGVTTFNTGDGRGFQNGCTIKIAKDATLKNGKADAPGYANVTFDIAGTLEVTGGVRWSLGSNSSTTLHEGAVLKGTGENDTSHSYAFDYFDGATITVDGDATIEGNIGAHNAQSKVITLNVAEGKTLTIVGSVKTGTIAASRAGTVKLASANTYTGGTTINEGATLVAANATALGTGNITLDGTLTFKDVETALSNQITQTDPNNTTNPTGQIVIDNSTVTLNGANGDYKGVITVNAGATLKSVTNNYAPFGNGASIVNNGAIDVTNNGAGDCAISAVISGSGSLTVSAGTLILGGANTYNGATTIAQGAKVIANSGASSTWDYVSNTDSVREPDVTVNGELEIQSSGELYRGFAGTGKITTSGNVTIGMTGDSGHVSGLTNFKGELIVAAETTLTLKGWGEPHDIELSSLQANGNVTATHAGQNASTTQITVQKLSGSGTITGANTFTLANGAIIDATNGAVAANTLNALPENLTVKIENALEVGNTLNILTTTATPNTESTTVTVKVGDGDTPAEGSYSLVATGSALQLVREADAPVEPEVEYVNARVDSNTGLLAVKTEDKANGRGVQVDLNATGPAGLALAAGTHLMKTFSIIEHPETSSGVTGVASGITITVYDTEDLTTPLATSSALIDADKTTVTIGDTSYTLCTFTFANPVVLDASKTYQFRTSAAIRVKMVSLGSEQMDVNLLNDSYACTAKNYSPLIELGIVVEKPAVSYVTDENTFSEKGNAGEGGTGSATLSGDWALTASSVAFQTTGAVGGTATILTPNVNVGTGGTWTLTFAPQDGEPRVVDAVSLDVVMFNSAGDKQTSAVQNRPLTLTVTDGTTELASYSGLLTGDDTVNPVVTATLNFAPTKVTQLQVTATRTDSTDAGCYYGISSFNVGTYEGATEVVEGNIPVEKGNVSDKSTSPMTKTDDSVWSVVSCKQLSTNADLGMKTGGTVGDDATIITPNVNVSSATSTAEGWALRYEADAPRKVESVTVTIQMFNGGGNVQNADNYTRAFKMTLKDVNGNELATTGDRTLQAVSGGTSRYPITLQIEPTELDTIVVEVSKGTADQGATGCFYGVSSFEVQLSQETTVLVNPTVWPSADMKLGAVYVGAEATLPAAPATQGGGIYKAEVFRSLNAGALENWTIDAATENQTMMTFTQNASVTMARPEAPEALRPSTQAMSVHFDDTPYFGELGIDYMPFTTATDVAILYVDSDDEIAYDSNAWWTSATEGAAATQGALGDKTPMLWLEGGKVVMTTGADAKPMTFHNETTNGTISIPAGVALAYGVTGEPSVSSPSIPRDVVVELGGALTMAGTLESVKLIGTGATLSGVNADNGDLTVTSIDATEGTDLTIAGGNVMLTNPPETLAVNLNGGNLAVTASADTTATLAKLTVTRNANLTGDISVAQLGGTARLTSEDTLTVTGETTFGGSLNGVNLVVADGASMTLSGTSSVSTIAGAGTLTMQGATLTLTAPSTFGGTLSVGQFSTLTCNASLTIQKTLQFLDTQAYLKTTNEVWVTIASGATIIPNATQHAANMDIAAGAMIDLSGAGDVADGELKLEAVKLPAGAGQGAVTVKGSRTSTVIDTESPLPVGLLVSNFCLAEDDDTLHFLLDSSYDRVALVKVMADLSERTEEERQDILLLAYMLELPIGEIENPDVALLFDGEYNKAYGFETVPVYDAEETIIALNLRYFVKFGISDISNVRQSDGSLLADVTAVVEPLEESESVSFENGVVVALYVNGQDEPLRTVTIEDNDVRQVVFENVELPEFAEGTGTHELTVRVQSQQ